MATREELQKEHADENMELDEMEPRLDESYAGLLFPSPVAPAAAPRYLNLLAKAEINCIYRTTIVEFFAKELHERATIRRQMTASAKRIRQDPDTKTIRESTVIEFSSAIFNDRGMPHVAFIRECFRDAADKVHEWMGTKVVTARPYSVFVGGPRGIGKSVFGALMVFELVGLGYAVLYEHKQQRMLLFGSNLRKEQKEELLNTFEFANYDASILSDPGVYEFSIYDYDDRYLFDRLIKCNSLLHVLDLGDGPIEQSLPSTGLTRRLILSSPDEPILWNLSELGCRSIIMPLWTLDELQMARRECYPHLTEHAVRAQFAKSGGNARVVLQFPEVLSDMEIIDQ